MLNVFRFVSASALAISLLLAGQAYAQSSHDAHHPDGNSRSAQTTQMPTQPGQMPSQMPGRDQMGQGMMGPGMMGQGMMGPGMMGPGMMGQGMMGQGMTGSGMQGMMQMMGGSCPMAGSNNMPAFIDGRLAFLKAELAITDPQKKAWEAYATALKTNMQSMQGMKQTMMTAISGVNPEARLDAYVSAMESRVKALKAVKPALSKLYGALSQEQKKKADQILTVMGCMM